ncbi:MAG: undecaprenyl-diphosphate phosphatase [Anaerolineae bacterium]
MTIWQAIFLGIVQGATEFIPVSSSGHLVLVPWLFGWQPPGLTYTVAAHLGAITAVLAYFWRVFWGIVVDSVAWVRSRDQGAGIRLLGLLLSSAVPAAVIGLAFEDAISAIFENPPFAAVMLSVTAVLLLVGERIGRLERDVGDMTWRDALIMGFAQALAILPGISRSGATIAAGRSQHMLRESAARFSFLMSAPVIVGAGLLQVVELLQVGISAQGIAVLVAGFVSAGVTSYLVIAWLLNFLKTRPVTIFAIYCFAASALCILLVLLRA